MVATIITTSPETAKTSSSPSLLMNYRPVLATIRKLSSRGKRKNSSKGSSTLEADAAAAVAESTATTESDSSSLTIEEQEQEPSRRRVRFEVDENDTIQPTYHQYESVSSQDKGLMYCSTEEMQQIKDDAKAFAAQHAFEHQEEYPQCIERLFDSPLNRNFIHASAYMTVDDAIQTLSGSEGRGLEMRMTKVTIKHMRFANKAVLSRYQRLKAEQNFLQQHNPSSISTAVVDKTKNADTFLRMRCLQLNKCTRELALALAKADEIEAFKIYSE